MIDESDRTKGLPRRFVWKNGIRLIAIAAVAAVVVLWPQLWKRIIRKSPTEAIVAASDTLEFRRLSGRTSIPVPYKPLEKTRRGHRPEDENDLPLLIAEQTITLEVKKDPSSENLRALASAHLLRRHAEKAEAILEALLSSTTGETEIARAITSSKDSGLLVDLSATYLARAQQSDGSEYAAFAAEAASRAWSLKPSREATWNRAAALHELGLYREAMHAWEMYLNIDPASPWANEARGELEKLKEETTAPQSDDVLLLKDSLASRETARQIVKRYPLKSMAYGKELLFAWARENNPGVAHHVLEQAGIVGGLLEDEAKDALIADCVRSIKSSDTTALERIRATINDLQQASGRENEFGDQNWRNAQGAFSGPAPLAILLILEDASKSFGRNEVQATLAALQRLDERVSPGIVTPYPSLVIRKGWLAGMSLIEIGRPHAAIAAYSDALAAAQQNQDVDSAAAIHALKGQALSLVGRSHEAWTERAMAFDLVSRFSYSHRLAYIAAEANVAAVEENLFELSSVFARIATADKSADTPIAAGSFMWVARRLYSVGRTKDALSAIDAARALIERIASPDVRARSGALIDLAEGSIIVNDEPARAIKLLNSSLRFFEPRNERLELAQLFEARSRAHDSLGDAPAASADVVRALAEFESQRGRIPDAATRESFGAARQRLFDRMIIDAMRRQNTASAFSVAERAKARWILDEIAIDSSPISLEQLQLMLPPETALLEYAVLEDRLVSWLITPRGIEQRVVPVQRTAVRGVIEATMDAVRRSDLAAFRAASGRLDSLLLAPVRPLLSGARLLVIIPDKDIVGVPFSSLYNVRDERYLFQSHDVILSPSASVFVGLAARQHKEHARGNSRLAVFVNSTVTGSLFPDLDRLEFAEIEARDLLTLSSSAAMHTDNDATPAKLLDALNRFSIVHFAGHAVVNSEDADLSALILNTEMNEATPLYARDIRRVHATATLVVLAACGTARPVKAPRRDGARSLTDAFLAAGVPAVIGSLWQVEDADSAGLLILFYKHVAEGLSYASSLREARTELMARTSGSASGGLGWIAYELTGTDGSSQSLR